MWDPRLCLIQRRAARWICGIPISRKTCETWGTSVPFHGHEMVMLRASSRLGKSPLAGGVCLGFPPCVPGQFFAEGIERLELAGDVSFGLLRVQVGQRPSTCSGSDCGRISGFYFLAASEAPPLEVVRVIFGFMGSKDKGKQETKKAPKPKPKVEPGRKRGRRHPPRRAAQELKV